MVKKIISSLGIIGLILSLSVHANFRPDNQFDEEKIKSLPKGTKILVLPLNPNRLLKEKEIVILQKEILTRLGKMKTVVTEGKIEVEQDRFDYFLLTSERAAQMPEARPAKQDYAKAVAGDNALVIIPSVIEKVGNFSDNKLFLDGNKLTVRWEGGGSNGSWRWSGQQIGLSLKLEIYNQQGEWLMTTYGGVSLPKYATLENTQFLRKDHIFEHKRDMKLMQKGIDIVLDPLKQYLQFR